MCARCGSGHRPGVRAGRPSPSTGSSRVSSSRAAHASCIGSRETASARSATAWAAHGERRPHQWQVPSRRITCRRRILCALRHKSVSTTSSGHSWSTASVLLKTPPPGWSQTLRIAPHKVYERAIARRRTTCAIAAGLPGHTRRSHIMSYGRRPPRQPAAAPHPGLRDRRRPGDVGPVRAAPGHLRRLHRVRAQRDASSRTSSGTRCCPATRTRTPSRPAPACRRPGCARTPARSSGTRSAATSRPW